MITSGDLTVTRSTFGPHERGSVRSITGHAVIADSTFWSDSVPDGLADSVRNSGSSMTLTNSILATNGTDPSCSDESGTMVNGGHNLGSDTSCVSAGTSLASTEPMLGPLADNGGPTATMLPQPASPALDAGGTACGSADQRGVLRPQGAACDIGAVEVEVEGLYDFDGFFAPVDNRDAGGHLILNKVKAGQAVPVKFSLGGNQGLDVFADGYPASTTIACDSTAEVDALETTATGGQSRTLLRRHHRHLHLRLEDPEGLGYAVHLPPAGGEVQ